ncbi:MAG: hypothetical protein HYT93_04615 [Parcubacteria group bacterium]|nr:hypothetical protein [Parcubacteria group bacterium]
MTILIFRFRKVDKARFEELKSGAKEIETRAATVKYQSIAIGDRIKFVCGEDSFSKIVNKKYHWPSIEAMVKEIPFKKIMPHVESVEEMKKMYVSYPGYTEKIQKFGIFGFEFKQ